MSVALTLVLGLTACGAAADAGASSGEGPLSTSYADALTIPEQLMLGTMALDGTEDAVTADQAASLLTLWKAYQSLSSDSSASDVEVQALVRQIEGGMTAAQLTSIAERRLTAADGSEIITGLDLSFGRAGFEGGAQGDSQIPFADQVQPFGGEGNGGFRRGDSPPEGFQPGGGPPEGFNPGAGGFGVEGGGDFSPEAIATQRAERQTSSGDSFGAREMLFPLIQYLNSLVDTSGS